MVNVGDEEGWASLLKSSVVKVVINFRAPLERQVKKFDTNPMPVSSYHHVYLDVLWSERKILTRRCLFFGKRVLRNPKPRGSDHRAIRREGQRSERATASPACNCCIRQRSSLGMTSWEAKQLVHRCERREGSTRPPSPCIRRRDRAGHPKHRTRSPSPSRSRHLMVVVASNVSTATKNNTTVSFHSSQSSEKKEVAEKNGVYFRDR